MHDASMSRRNWLGAATGLGVAGLAAAVVWRTSMRQTKALTDAEMQFWQQSFVALDGAPMPTSAFKGKPLVLNFWATWCPPCVEELPSLNVFYNENKAKGWQILGLAVDQVTPVKRFLNQMPLDFSVAMAGFAGLEISKSLGNLSGALPFTVVFDASGAMVHRKMGKVNADDLLAWSRIKI